MTDFEALKTAGLRAIAAKPGIAALCRKDPVLFTGYVMRNDRNGKPLTLAPMHKVWHDLMSRHSQLVIWAHVEAGKSQQCSIARVLWEIGNDPAKRVLILSNTHGQASKIAKAIAAYIENSRELHEVFPDLVPTDRNVESWQPLSGVLTVKRLTISKDPTISVSGVHGNILGARFDLVILDDVLDPENTRTDAGRKGLIEWLQAAVHGRLTAQAKMWVVGTAFHPDDALHYYAKIFSRTEQRAFQYPVLDAAGQARWPEVWPLERIEQRRDILSPLEFARQMLCQAHDDSAARFKREWFDVCERRGADKMLVSKITNVPAGVKIITGVDLAVSRKDSADLTVLFTIAVWPNGDREILEIQSGRWAGPDIVSRIVDTHKRFYSFVIVENNAAQDYLVQYTQQHGIPVRGFTTTTVKNHPELGIESLAGELAAGRWIIPSKGGLHKEVQLWKDGLLYYDPGVHTSDHVMASYFAVKGIEMTETRQARAMHIDWASR